MKENQEIKMMWDKDFISACRQHLLLSFKKESHPGHEVCSPTEYKATQLTSRLFACEGPNGMILEYFKSFLTHFEIKNIIALGIDDCDFYNYGYFDVQNKIYPTSFYPNEVYELNSFKERGLETVQGILLGVNDGSYLVIYQENKSKLVQALNESYELSLTINTVAHCHQGTGRTGHIIMIFFIFELFFYLHSKKDSLSLKSPLELANVILTILSALREKVSGFVHTSLQLTAAYDISIFLYEHIMASPSAVLKQALSESKLHLFEVIDIEKTLGNIHEETKVVDHTEIVETAVDKLNLARLHYTTAYSQAGKGKAESLEGPEEYREIIKMNNKSILSAAIDILKIHFTRAHCYFSLGKIEDAIQDLNIAINGNYCFAEVYFLRGRCHTILKNLSGAVDDFLLALELDRSYVDSLNCEYINMLVKKINDDCSESQKIISNYQQAIRLYDKLINLNAEEESYLSSRAYLKGLCGDEYLILGNWELAKENYLRALEEDVNWRPERVKDLTVAELSSLSQTDPVLFEVTRNCPALALRCAFKAAESDGKLEKLKLLAIEEKSDEESRKESDKELAPASLATNSGIGFFSDQSLGCFPVSEDPSDDSPDHLHC